MNLQMLFNNLMKSSKYQEALELTKKILSSGKSKEQMLKEACSKSGLNEEQVKQALKDINLNG